MDVFLSVVEAALPSLLVGIVLALFNRARAKRDAETEEQERGRSEEELVKLSLLVAAAKLSYALAAAVKRGAANGEVEEGILQYREAMKAFKQLERRTLAERSTQD